MSEPRKTPCRPSRELACRIVDSCPLVVASSVPGILRKSGCREQAGLFDVSHMGEIRSPGPDAEAFVQKVFTNDLASLPPGKVRYSPMCYPTGGTVDDVLIYRLAADQFWLVVNAANKDKDFAWLLDNVSGFAVTIDDESDETAEIALQGRLQRK